MPREDSLVVGGIALLLAVVAVWLFVRVRRNTRTERETVRRAARLVEPDIVTPPRDAVPSTRPWWGNPWLWIAISAVFVGLGLFVWPWMFGGVFLFVPFVWFFKPKPETMDPRTNGHSKRDGASF